MTHLDVLESRYDRRLGAVAVIVSAAVVVVGLWAPSIVALVLGAVGLPSGLWLLVDRRVKLRVDEVGVLYSRWGYTPIQWSEIAAVELASFRGVEQVCIVPVDPARLAERLPPPDRWTGRLTEKLWGCRFVLSTSALEHGTPQLLEVLRRYHEARA